jgi:hypothetical protein
LQLAAMVINGVTLVKVKPYCGLQQTGGEKQEEEVEF